MKFRIKPSLAVTATSAVLAATMFGVPANGAPSISSSLPAQQQNSTKQNEEAKRFYESFWFATGPNVQKLSKQVANESFQAYLAKGNQDAEVRQIANRISDRLESDSPGYLVTVHERMSSGDAIVVERTMKEASERTLALMNELYPAAQEKIQTAEATPNAVAFAAIAVAVVVVWSGAVLVNYAGAVNVAGAVNAVGWFNAKTSVNVSSFSARSAGNEAIDRDTRERMIASITTGLAR